MRGAKRTLGLVALAATMSSCSMDRAEQQASDTRDTQPEEASRDSADMLADGLMAAGGGEDAWTNTRFIGFRWLVERGGEIVADRQHAWDRFEGEYRLEFERADERTLALFNVNSIKDEDMPMAGDVWLNGQRLEGAARDSALERSYAIFINDTYWLLMPFKWKDPGVHLAYEGVRRLSDGRQYMAVHLTYDEGLGVTEDEFWGFVDPENGQLAAWQYHLEGREEKGQVVWWRDWQQVGPLRLAMDRRWEEGDTRIYFMNVRAGAAVPEGIFAPPTR